MKKRFDFTYHLSEGFRSIFTHGFMSFASVCMIVACLIIMGSFSLVAINLDHNLTQLEQDNEFLAYVDENLTETVQFVKLLQSYGVDLICATIGSPYYNVHMQRPAYFPVCDGYLPPEHPLYNVSRHLKAVKRIRELCPGIKVVGSGYTCLQEYLPHAAEYAVEHDETDFVGIGRMVLSYPEICTDSLNGIALDRKRICRTLGDCTNGPRNGFVSGCYPLDEFYRSSEMCPKLKAILKDIKF